MKESTAAEGTERERKEKIRDKGNDGRFRYSGVMQIRIDKRNETGSDLQAVCISVDK